jgi:hypothetical protein
MSYEEEDTCMSNEEEDTCMSYEEEDTCVSYEEEDTCAMLMLEPLDLTAATDTYTQTHARAHTHTHTHTNTHTHTHTHTDARGAGPKSSHREGCTVGAERKVPPRHLVITRMRRRIHPSHMRRRIHASTSETSGHNPDEEEGLGGREGPTKRGRLFTANNVG